MRKKHLMQTPVQECPELPDATSDSAITAEVIEDGRVLVITLHEIATKKQVLRTFIDREAREFGHELIFRGEGVKNVWSEATYEYIADSVIYGANDYGGVAYRIFEADVPVETEILVNEYLGNFKNDVGTVRKVEDLLERIGDTRRQKREDAATAKTEREMELVDSLGAPDGFAEWLDGEVFKPIALFKTTGKKRMGYCTACGGQFELDRNTETKKLHHANWTCPDCGREVILQQNGWTKENYRHQDVAMIQVAPDGRLVIRYYQTTQRLTVEQEPEKRKRVTSMTEVMRFFITGKGKVTKYGTQYLGFYKTSVRGWYRGRTDGREGHGEPIVYTGNLKKDLAGTPWQYSAMDILVKGHKPDPVAYMGAYPRMPQLEYLVKMGAGSIAMDVAWMSEKYAEMLMDRKSNAIYKALRISKQDLMTAVRYDLSLYEIAGAEELRRKFGKITEDDILLFKDVGMYINDMIVDCPAEEHPRRLCRYLDKMRKQLNGGIKDERVRHYTHELFNVYYRDYIRAMRMENAGRPMTREELEPRDLIGAHNREMERDRMRREKEAAEMEAHASEMVAKRKPGLEKAYAFERFGMRIVVPGSAEDFATEGALNCNCVGSYRKRHAKGETTVLFMRKLESLGTPYITIEVRRDEDGVNKIMQARGKCNRRLNEREKYAVDLFERTVVRKVKDKKAENQEEVQMMEMA